MSEVPQPLQQALLLMRQGEGGEAELLLRQLMAEQPQWPQPPYLLGLVLVQSQRMAEAASAFAAACRLQPAFLPAWLNNAAALEHLDQLEAALAQLQQAMAFHRDQPDLLAAAGRLAVKLERWSEAQALLEQALAGGIPISRSGTHLGIALLEQGQHLQAVAVLHQVVQQQPQDPQALYNLALALKDAQQLEAALQALDQLLALAPKHPGLHGNRAIVLFLLGRYREAWQEYQWRLVETPQIVQQPQLRQYHRQMGRVNRLLVLAEQGLGDSFQFVRYIDQLSKHAASIRCVLQPALVPLVQHSFPTLEVLAGPLCQEHLDGVDAWLPLISAAALLDVTPTQPQVVRPYLKVPDARQSHWQQRLGSNQQKRVALVWQGNPTAERGHARGRSLPLAALAPLMNAGLELISLQRGPGSEQIDALGWRHHFHPLQSEIDAVWAFEEVGAILKCCDLLISTDTAITHLAGALNHPALLLLKWTPDWRWGLESEHCFWYPRHQLVRQKENEPWEQTVLRMLENNL